MSLDPSVIAQIENGRVARLDLFRVDIPGLEPKGYHMGGRDFTFNGLVYKPNRWLNMGSMNSAVGTAVTARTITFSDIPVDDPDDAMSIIEQYNYQNAPVIIAHLCGVPGTSDVLGVLASSIYEIDQVRYNKGALNGSERTLTMEIDLQPPGRSARGSTGVKRSLAEQQFDNSPTDTAFEYVATNASIPEEWGQKTG